MESVAREHAGGPCTRRTLVLALSAVAVFAVVGYTFRERWWDRAVSGATDFVEETTDGVPLLPTIGKLVGREVLSLAVQNESRAVALELFEAIARAAVAPEWHPRMPITDWLRALVPLSARRADFAGLRFDSTTSAQFNLTRPPTADALRVTDDMLVRDVTAIVTFKEAIDIVRLSLPALIALVPREMVVVAVIGGPCDECRTWVDAFATEVVAAGISPNFNVVHLPDFTTAARARVDGSVRAFCHKKYTFFVNADIFFGTPHALRELYAEAEWGEERGDLYVPAMVEIIHGSIGKLHGPHPASTMSFALSPTGVADMIVELHYGVRVSANETVSLETALMSNTPASEMTATLEDHAFFVRDAHRRGPTVFDPFGSITGEAQDGMMNALYAGTRVMLSTRSWFALALTDIATANDLPFVTWRRCDYLCASTTKYQARKWNMRSRGAGFCPHFRMRALEHQEWSELRGNLPRAPCKQLVLAAAMATTIGFTAYHVDAQPASLGVEGARDALWHDAYPALSRVCRLPEATSNSPMLNVTVQTTLAVRWKADPPDYFTDADRRVNALRDRAPCFTVRDTAELITLGGVSQTAAVYPAIAVAHIRGLRWNSTATEVLSAYASLCWSRDAGATSECVFLGQEGFEWAQVLEGAPVDATVITRQSEGMPLSFVDGPLGRFRVHKVAYRMLYKASAAGLKSALNALQMN